MCSHGKTKEKKVMNVLINFIVESLNNVYVYHIITLHSLSLL